MQWQQQRSYFWQEAPFFRLLLAFVPGIVCYDAGYIHTAAILYATLLLVLLTAVLAFVRRRNKALDFGFFTTLQLALFTTAVSVCYINDVRTDTRWFGHQLGRGTGTVVRVLDVPLEKTNTWKLHVAAVESIRQGRLQPATGDAFIYTYKTQYPLKAAMGDVLLVPATWQPVHNSGNPFEFDFATYCARAGIYYEQFLPGGKLIILHKGVAGDQSWITRCHYWCMAQLAKYVTDKPSLGLLQGILIGDEVNMDTDLRQTYAETGIIHIVAISGSHLTIFFLFIAGLLFWIKHKKHQWIKYALAVPLAWIYVFMCGAPPSAMRAVIMFTIVAAAVILQREQRPLNILMGAAFTLLCAQPMWLFSVGFQLSFLAVLSLILFYRPIYKTLAKVGLQRWRVVKITTETIAASLAAELLVAPLVVYYFHMFPIGFLIANVLAVLFAVVAMALGGLIIVCSGIPAAATFVAQVATCVIRGFHTILEWLQGLNPVSFRYLLVAPLQLIVTYLVITFLALFALKKLKWTLPAGLIAACFLLVLLCQSEYRRERQRHLVVYNSGKKVYAEVISGSHYYPLTEKAANDYAIKEAHTGYQAFWPGELQGTAIVGGKRIAIADSANTWQYATQPFPADILILQHFKLALAGQLRAVFQPKQVICGSAIFGKSLAALKDSCAHWGIQVYALHQSGAYLLSE